MSGTHHASTYNRAIIGDHRGERLPIPEAAMFIVAASGALWALIFGGIRWFVG